MVGIFSVDLNHREHRILAGIHAFVLQDLVVVLVACGGRDLRDAPSGVDEVANVQEVEAHLELMLLLAGLETEILGDTQVDN